MGKEMVSNPQSENSSSEPTGKVPKHAQRTEGKRGRTTATVSRRILPTEGQGLDDLVATKFITAWTRLPKDPSDRDELKPTVGEWNPVHHGHSLMALQLPWKMLLECISDPRLYETECISDCKIHSDPLVAQFMTFVWCEFMRQAHQQWRVLRATDDFGLCKHLNILTDLNNAFEIRPFTPLAMFLEDWSKWRERCSRDGVDACTYKRPMLPKHADKFLENYGALAREKQAVNRLKDLLREAGMKSAKIWERDVTSMLGVTTKRVQELCKERDSAFLLDCEGYYESLEEYDHLRVDPDSLKVARNPSKARTHPEAPPKGVTEITRVYPSGAKELQWQLDHDQLKVDPDSVKVAHNPLKARKRLLAPPKGVTKTTRVYPSGAMELQW